jgi:hypothetical protein
VYFHEEVKCAKGVYTLGERSLQVSFFVLGEEFFVVVDPGCDCLSYLARIHCRFEGSQLAI